MTTLRGTLQRIKYQGKGFWSVVELIITDGHTIAVGKLPCVQEGDSLELHGEWMEDQRWGKQFKFNSHEVVTPMDSEGIIAWLCTLPDVGRSRAMELVKAFGADGVFHVIEHDPESLTSIAGITPARADAIRKSYLLRKSQRDVMCFLKRFGLTDNQCAKIVEKHGERTIEAIQADPYVLTSLNGFGFLTVDSIALRAGVKKDSIQRAIAGVQHMLCVAKEAGHVYVPRHRLVKRCLSDLEIPAASTEEAIKVLVGDGNVVLDPEENNAHQGVYLADLHQSEQAITNRITSFIKKEAA